MNCEWVWECSFTTVADDDIPSATEPANHVQDSLLIPDYGTSSSTSFDLEKAATRIEQLAASDSDETDFRNNEQKKDLPVTYRSASEISDVSEDDDSGSSASEDTSYSADVSRASDFEEPCEIDENSKKEVKNGDDEGGNERIILPCVSFCVGLILPPHAFSFSSQVIMKLWRECSL